MFVYISFYDKQLILIFAAIGILLILWQLILWHLIQFKDITLLDYLINIFPEDIVDDIVANLAALRERLTKEEKSPWLVQFILFCQILTLAWGICIEMNIDNITLPSRDRRIDK
jgi:hypothetical protein